MTHATSTKNKAFNYRKQGKSYSDISNLLSIPMSTLCTWFKNDIKSNEIRLRNIEEAKRICSKRLAKYNKTRAERYKKLVSDELQENAKTLPTLNNKALFWLGLGLFMAEGSKTERWSVKFTNSDPVIIKAILRFFRESCQVPESKIRLQLFLHSNCIERDSLNYWSKIAKVPKERFWKTQIIQTPSSKAIRSANRLPYGTLRIAIPDTSLNRKIYGWMLGLKNI